MLRLMGCSAINFGAQFHCTVLDRFSDYRVDAESNLGKRIVASPDHHIVSFGHDLDV